ncbi:kinase-regulated stress-responsive transcription factor skn7 [Entophlyctis sp. JEL0112]|nr:kinase-regulated stress-responsive transcription factor skn7 [Entophlyctis sp. JEL0112]
MSLNGAAWVASAPRRRLASERSSNSRDSSSSSGSSGFRGADADADGEGADGEGADGEAIYLRPRVSPFSSSSISGNSSPSAVASSTGLAAADIASASACGGFPLPQAAMSRIPSNSSVLALDGDCDSASNSALPRKKHKPDEQKVALFIATLFNAIASNSHSDQIVWAPDGTSFFVRNTNDFAQTVLPRLYGHRNFQSFVRQLNKYNFRKVRAADSDSTSEKEKELSTEFRHDLFRRDRPDLLCLIFRKKTAQKRAILEESAVDNGTSSPAEPVHPSEDPLVASRMGAINTEAAQRIIAQLEEKVKNLTEVQKSTMNSIAQVYQKFNSLKVEMMQLKGSVVQEKVAGNFESSDPRKNIGPFQINYSQSADRFPPWQIGIRQYSRACLPQKNELSSDDLASNLFNPNQMSSISGLFSSSNGNAASNFPMNNGCMNDSSGVPHILNKFGSPPPAMFNPCPAPAGFGFDICQLLGTGPYHMGSQSSLDLLYGRDLLNTRVSAPFEPFPSSTVQEPLAAKQSRALVIADSTLQTVFIHSLKSLGMMVDHIPSAAFFKLRYIDNQLNSGAIDDTKQYDVVLCDLDVKWLECASKGATTAQLIRMVISRESSQTKVVAVTSAEEVGGDKDTEQRLLLQGLGVAEVLKKPVASRDVQRLVHRLLG